MAESDASSTQPQLYSIALHPVNDADAFELFRLFNSFNRNVSKRSIAIPLHTIKISEDEEPEKVFEAFVESYNSSVMVKADCAVCQPAMGHSQLQYRIMINRKNPQLLTLFKETRQLLLQDDRLVNDVPAEMKEFYYDGGNSPLNQRNMTSSTWAVITHDALREYHQVGLALTKINNQGIPGHVIARAPKAETISKPNVLKIAQSI